MNRCRAAAAAMGITGAAVAGLMLFSPAGQREMPVTVETCQVEVGSVEQVVALTGMLRYEVEYAAISPFTGVVAQVYVVPGERVEAGQPLFRLDEKTQMDTLTSGVRLLPAGGLEQAQLREAASILEGLTVRAAVDGIVQQVNITPYGGIAAGEPAMLLTGRKQTVRCSAVLCDAEALKEGMQARILHQGDVAAEGVVTHIGAAQANEAGQVICQVELLPDRRLQLPLGALVEAEIICFREQNVPVVPIQAITENETVWWVADGYSYEIPVQVMMADEMNCWVNLSAGTKVICDGSSPGEGKPVKEKAL